jgi:hypothetical protein
MALSRRDFLKSSAATTMAMTAPGAIASQVLAAPSPSELKPGPGNKWPGRVVINFNKDAIKGTSTVVDAVVQQMVNDSILKLTGESTIGAAWKAIFPNSLTVSSKIAIKVYAATPETPSHWQAIKAMTDGMQQMDFNGTKFSPNNIFIYEGNASNKNAEAGFTPEHFPGIKIDYWGTKDTFADGAGNEAAGDIKDRAYAPTLKNADFLINAFNPHGHNMSQFENFSLGFKSHVGTFTLKSPNDIHTNGAQNLRDMNCTGPVFKKNVLSACIGIVACNEAIGPLRPPDDFSKYSKTMDPNSTCIRSTTIIMSTDPISCEMQTIKMMRLNKSKNYGVADMPNYLKASAGVSSTLSGTGYNIGIIDESKMEIRRIINGVTAINSHNLPVKSQNPSTIAVSPLDEHGCTFIEYSVQASHIGQKASIAIYSLNGALVRKHSQSVLGANNHFSWDHKDQAGRHVTAGKYVVHVTSEAVSLSSHFIIRS